MPRVSAFRGSWVPNKRPYVVLTPDAYMSLQGETSVIACGECKREVNFNKYITSISTEASVDSPPGGGSVTLSIPDNDVNEFYVDGQFIIIPMMEVELFAKGYYTVGGFPQYYRIFWGVVSSVSKQWSNGVTTINLSFRDILRWWELTNVILQPGFLEAGKSQAGWSLFQNRFAGSNPYVVIITLAREAMGDFSLTTGSFTSFRPESGPEQGVIASYAKDIMAYWQLKFGNIWNSLVLYGTSGQAYTFQGNPGNVSPLAISKKIFQEEDKNLNLNPETSAFKIQPHEIAAFKVEVTKAGDVEFFQNETQSKLAIALTARDQAGAYEFYCDTTGDIVFKPPFFNLNVMPNKPVSWINDFEIISENIHDTEQEVYTHVTASGNAFGGVTDYGLNDDITTPRTGVIDWHLLKRYGWRRIDVSLEWAGNPRKLFYHLLDHMDKVNSKRQNGSVTIPMRPEIRMGFPVWFPKYDSFYYIQGVSHNFSPGGQATTVLTLTAKRSKFIAPKNIGRVFAKGSRTITTRDSAKKEKTRIATTYAIEFPSEPGGSSGLNRKVDGKQKDEFGGPAVLRDAKTGKLLGFPNVVMVYRTTLSGTKLALILESLGSDKSKKPKKKNVKGYEGPSFGYTQVTGAIFVQLQNEKRAETIDRLRSHRYEAGMTNSGAYDYAHDENGAFTELSVVPSDHVLWGTGTKDPDKGTESSGSPEQGAQSVASKKEQKADFEKRIKPAEADQKEKEKTFKDANKIAKVAEKDFNTYLAETYKGQDPPPGYASYTEEDLKKLRIKEDAQEVLSIAQEDLKEATALVTALRAGAVGIRKLAAINTMVRPVSDDFGFEVIGHYRYGRGAFIDRGQVQVSSTPGEIDNNSNVANKLNIQFAARGGLITDNPAERTLGPESKNFEKAFEQMVPDDYVTGATFKGANYSQGAQLQAVNPTGQATYTNSINNAVTKAGKAVFAEADAVRRGVTLGELKPTLDGLGPDVQFEKCGCSLNKVAWLSVLPLSVLQSVLGSVRPRDVVVSTGVAGALAESGFRGGVTGETLKELVEQEERLASVAGTVVEGGIVDALRAAGVNLDSDADIFLAAELSQTIGDQSVTVSQGGFENGGQFLNDVTGKGGFFDALHEYLVERFNTDYKSKNMRRENYAAGGSVDVARPDTQGIEFQDNLLGTIGGSLYDRASLGDPEALKALQDEINFDFGASSKALDDFKKKVDSVAAQAEKDFIEVRKSFERGGADPGERFGGDIIVNNVSVFTDPIPVTTPDEPMPSLGDLANPSDLFSFRPDQQGDDSISNFDPLDLQPGEEGTDLETKIVEASAVPDNDDIP